MSVVAILYIIVIVSSVIVATLLVRLAQLSARVHVEAQSGDSHSLDTEHGLTDKAELKKSVYDQIQGIADPKKCDKIASSIVEDIFEKELNATISQKTQELSRKYKTVIDQSQKNEEVAWEKYKKVLSDKKETEAVVRSIAEGLVVVDSKGNVVMANPAAERLLGSTGKNKIGKPILDNLKEEQLITLMKDSGPDGKEIEVISQKDETKKTLRSSSAVIEDENGQTVGMVSVLSDITKQKELDQLKQNFVSNVTHELRTPLIAIRKSVIVLLTKSAGALTPIQESFLSLADRNLKRLSSLIDDLLDLAKMEGGKMEVKPQPASIEMTIDESVRSLQAWASSKSINIESSIQKDMPMINIDADRIIQVMNNLIGNAIKFTPEKGTITVEAQLTKEKSAVEISVEDTGVGLRQEDTARIFDKFYQTGERSYTDIGGTGIGLAIVKEIVALHKGSIKVESREGKGAKFIFYLPAQQQNN